MLLEFRNDVNLVEPSIEVDVSDCDVLLCGFEKRANGFALFAKAVRFQCQDIECKPRSWCNDTDRRKTVRSIGSLIGIGNQDVVSVCIAVKPPLVEVDRNIDTLG